MALLAGAQLKGIDDDVKWWRALDRDKWLKATTRDII